MSSAKKGTSLLTESGVGILLVLFVGAGLAFVFKDPRYTSAPQPMLKAVALGLVWAALIINWIDLIIQSLGLTTDPIPEALDFSDTEAVTEYLTSPAGKSALAVRAHRLLQSVAHGASGAQIAAQASLQSQQANNAVNGMALFCSILLAAGLWDAGNTTLAFAALILLAVTVLVRKVILVKTDAILENRIVSQVRGAAPVVAPKAAAPDSGKSSAVVVEAINRAFDGLKQDLSQLSTSVSGFSSNLGSVGSNWGNELQGVLSRHADAVTSANSQLATQLDRILAIQKDIDKVLKVGDAVDRVAASVAATAEFQNTLAAIRQHLVESDSVLRELSKPKKIRLVENPSVA